MCTARTARDRCFPGHRGALRVGTRRAQARPELSENMNWHPRHLRRAVIVVALAFPAFACNTVQFRRVLPPNLQEQPTLAAPAIPETRPVKQAEPEVDWAVVDRSSRLARKNALKRKTMALEVIAVGASSSRPDTQPGPLTTRLAARFTRTRRGRTVRLDGTLSDMLSVAAPIRADVELTVRFLLAPAPPASRDVHFVIPQEALERYATLVNQYRAGIEAYEHQIDTIDKQYAQAFAAAKADYKRRRGSYLNFPVKTSGQAALEQHDRVERAISQARASATAALAAVPDADTVRRIAEGKIVREVSSGVRVVATARLVDLVSSRVLWIGMASTTAPEPGPAVVRLLDKIPAVLP